MKLKFKFFLLIVACVASIYGEQVSLIGSHLAPAESNYKTFLLTNGLNAGSTVDVKLSSSTKNFRSFSDNSFDEVDLGRPRGASNKLTISSKVRGSCRQQSATIINSDRPIIFLQFAKPFYKVGEEFKFRVFLLNQKLVPYTGNQRTDVEIFDSKGQTVKKFNNIRTTEFGVFENSVEISQSENLGKWKIQVSSEGRVITKKFTVQQPSKNGLEAYLDMAKTVAFPDRKVFMNIYVKDRFSKIFSGEAKIFLSARFKGSQTNEINSQVKTVKIFGNKVGVALDFQDDLEIRFPTADMILRFDVDVTDTETRRTTTVSREVEMIYSSRNKIQTSRKKYFKPGFKYAMKVKVKTVDGNPDNSFNKLSMSVEYHNGGNKIDKQNFAHNLKNGEASTPLNPKTDTTKIVVNLEFAGAKLTEVIERLPTLGGNDYMQVTVTGKNLKVGEDVKLQAQVTQEMEKLHVIVIGLNGVVHSQEFPDALGKDIHHFTIKLTEDMKPESRGIAFYVRPSDGAIIYDEFTLNLGLSIANSLDISTVETGKPNEEVLVDMKTSRGAQVFLTATDQVTPQLIPHNEISRSEIYNELTYYLNYKFPNSSLHHFEKFNGFVLQPGQQCGSGNVQDYKFESDEEDQLPEDAKYFPRTWFDVSLDATSDNVQLKAILPKSLSTWKYYGISVHPENGFTIAKVQPKTVVKNEIALQVKTPPKVSKDEVVWVEIGVINALRDSIQSNIFVSIENGMIVQDQDEMKFNIKCTKFSSINKKDLTISRISLQSEKKTDIAKIPIMSNGNGELIVKVNAVAGNNNDKVERNIKIDNEVEPITNNGNFDIEVAILRDDTIIINVSVLQRQLASRDVVLDMELPRGYRYVSHQQNNKIDSEEVDDNSVVFYLKQLGYNQNLRLEVKVAKVYTIDQHRQSAINVYDYSYPAMKDTIHYHIDVNSDNCDRIEVTEYKNKARDAEMITNEAQRTADENSSQVDAAQQQVKDAQDKLEKALQDIQEAKRIAEEADNKAKEAFDVAAAAWTVVEETRIQEQSKTFVPVQKDISAEDQSNKIPKTATEAHEMAKIAQQEADAAQDELAEAEDSVSNAQDNAYEAKKALDSALKNLKDAQKEATGATNQANEIRTDAQQASRKVPGLQQNIQNTQRNLETSQKAIEAARKKANQMMEDVKAATILVNDALRRVNAVKISPDIINVVQAARERSEATQSFVNSLQSKVLNDMKNINQPLSVAKKMWEDAVSLSSDCNTIKRSADNAYRSSGNVKTKINNVKLSFDRSQNSYNHALNDLNDARVKRDSAKQKLTAAQARKEQLDEEARRMDEQESVEKETTTTAPRTTSKTSFTRGRTTTTKSSSTQPNRFVTTPKWVSQTTALPTSDSNESSHVDETEQKSEEEKCKMWYRFCKFGL